MAHHQAVASIYVKTRGAWTAVPLPAELRTGVAYHYTTAAGLLGIVANDEVWASSALSLNDLSEVTYGMEVFAEAVDGRTDPPSGRLRQLLDDEKFSPLRESAYFFSATEQQDSLGQWIGYAGNQGYALGFDMSVTLRPRRRDGAEPVSVGAMAPEVSGLMSTFGWYRVIYDRGQQLDAVRQLLDFCAAEGLMGDESHGDTHALAFFGALLPQFKHPAFADEREVRFIAARTDEAVEDYRSGPFGIVPYARIVGANSDTEGAWSSTGGDKLPLARIVTGPSNADMRDLLTATTRRLLESTGYGGVEVTSSDAPYRF